MNRATRTIVSVVGMLLALAGIDHGFFEILQGNAPTNGLIIQAIGDEQQMWFYGTEEAFTVLPTFLLTGVAAVTVSLGLGIWAVGYVHTRHGARVFGLLCVLLFLVGGGIAAAMTLAPITWAAATRIHRPLTWWRRVLPARARPMLARLWPYSLSLASASFLIGLSIAVFGYVPGVHDPERIFAVCWAFVFGGGLGGFLLSFVAGFASDIEAQARAEAS